MADTLTRAQVKPGPGVWTLLFGAIAPTVISTIRACNLSAPTDIISIRKILAGAIEEDSQFLVHSVALPWGIPYALTEGESLLDGDAIWVWSQKGTTAFNLSGVEIG